MTNRRFAFRTIRPDRKSRDAIAGKAAVARAEPVEVSGALE